MTTELTKTTTRELGAFDPFKAMDALDDAAILAELEGQVIDKWVYHFPQEGQEIWGLSKVGVDQACREMALKGEVMREEDVFYQVDPTDSRYVLFKSFASRVAVNKDGQEIHLDRAAGTKRQCVFIVTRKEGVTNRPNEFWFEQGSIKALRNARLRLISEEVRSKILALAKAKGKVTEVKKPDTIKTDHWCETHNTKFFKTPKMKGYAHPLTDGAGWCNEGDVDQGKTKAQLKKDKDEFFGEPLTAQATQATVVKAEVKPVSETPERQTEAVEKKSKGITPMVIVETSPAKVRVVPPEELERVESNGITPVEAVERGKQKPKRDITTLKTIEQLAKALKEDFGLSYQEQWNELNIRNWNDLAISPAEAYAQVEAVRKKSAN